MKRYLLCISVLLAACQASPSESQDIAAPVEPKPSEGEAEPVILWRYEKDAAGFLLTFIDQKGEFHIAEQRSDVPDESRKLVRIIREDQAPGSEEFVYVSDLSREAESFDVRPMKRALWEDQGKEGRQERLAALPKIDSSENKAIDSRSARSSLGAAKATLYGASWCGACRAAEKYLRAQGIEVRKVDIEEDPQGRKEMQTRLRSAGLRGSSIPVLDIGGIVLQGFSQGAVDAALKRVLKKQSP
ncbi:MAG: glutaredoxin family protein [Polyangiaceae bacterium]|nr:glutaredoxin family protein [Polyangiaceae bacterium]